MTLSTLTATPEAPAAAGVTAYAETTPALSGADLALRMQWMTRSADVRQQAIARAARPDYPAWLSHVKAASACTRPVRLAGTIATIEAATGRILSEASTAGMPDGVIYKPCGNRRESVCPACSKRYQHDAYHVVRSGLVGGKGVPEDVATHPAVFPTFTAPGFGEVHTRAVKRHTCARRKDCDCRPEPCHARRDLTVCPHGVRLACFARHENSDRNLGTPLCLDCYDHDAQVVWNLASGELWRRTTIAINRYIRRLTRERGMPWVPVFSAGRVRMVPPVRLSFGKAAEMQRRAVVHFHAIIRLDGIDPADPTAIVPPPPGIDAADLVDAVDHAARTVRFTTDPHPARRDGWPIAWGKQVHTKVITVAADGEVTDGMVAAYLAKYATKSTEVTGHTSNRLNNDTIDLYADRHGTHAERLVEACWRLAHARWVCPAALCQHHTDCPACVARREAAASPEPSPYVRLRRWAHMLGFGGHFLTKSRRYSVTFRILRDARVIWRRTINHADQAAEHDEETTVVINTLAYTGAGWRNTGDAMLANAAAAAARERDRAGRDAIRDLMSP
jgi:hypothetical protein